MEYDRECQFCGNKWKGRKKEVVSCPRCKRRFDYPAARIPGEQDALKFVEFNLIRAGFQPSVARKEAKFRLNKIIDQIK